MANDVDAGETENTNQVGTSGGAPSFGGRFLRFAGMAIIVLAILFALVFLEELGPGPFIGLLAVGSAGAAMHYKGRQLAPGKLGGSILGGIFGAAIGSAAFIIGLLFFMAMFLDGCKAFFKL